MGQKRCTAEQIIVKLRLAVSKYSSDRVNRAPDNGSGARPHWSNQLTSSQSSD